MPQHKNKRSAKSKGNGDKRSEGEDVCLDGLARFLTAAPEVREPAGISAVLEESSPAEAIGMLRNMKVLRVYLVR